jgi:hypothetical protein
MNIAGIVLVVIGILFMLLPIYAHSDMARNRYWLAQSRLRELEKEIKKEKEMKKKRREERNEKIKRFMDLIKKKITAIKDAFWHKIIC